jgi:rfaE bifunctional protein nucleotidyltransferase chain/domain
LNAGRSLVIDKQTGNDTDSDMAFTKLALRDKIMSREQLAVLCAHKHSQGERVVFTNGCFDLLHAGHVLLLDQARAWGDFLVVGLNSDCSVSRLKGKGRPVNGEESRALVLAALEAVGAVCVFEEETPIALIGEIRPDLHVKGGDYQIQDLPESAFVRSVGAEIRIVPFQAGHSSTSIRESLRSDATTNKKKRPEKKHAWETGTFRGGI